MLLLLFPILSCAHVKYEAHCVLYQIKQSFFSEKLNITLTLPSQQQLHLLEQDLISKENTRSGRSILLAFASDFTYNLFTTVYAISGYFGLDSGSAIK